MPPRSRTMSTPSLEPAEDLSAPESYPPDTSSGKWVRVHTPYGLVHMTPEGAAQYEAEVEAQYAERQDVDNLARAWDASMAPMKQEPQSMNGQQGGELPPDVMAILQQYADEGRLNELFQPYQQEQAVLDQQMQLAGGLRQRGPQRGTPTGALFSGLANAAGSTGGALLQQRALEGQQALGRRQQEEASGRVGALLRAIAQRRGGATPALATPAVSDEELASIFSGGQ